MIELTHGPANNNVCCECGKNKDKNLWYAVTNEEGFPLCNLCKIYKIDGYVSYRVKLSKGEKYGHLTIVEFSHSTVNDDYYTCTCDCGSLGTTIQSRYSIFNKSSSGCSDCTYLARKKQGLKRLGPVHAAKERREKIRKSNYTYDQWWDLKKSFFLKKHPKYEYYASNGITLDERWHDYENFLEDMGIAPRMYMYVVRKDNKKGFTKENTVWSTSKELVKENQSMPEKEDE